MPARRALFDKFAAAVSSSFQIGRLSSVAGNYQMGDLSDRMAKLLTREETTDVRFEFPDEPSAQPVSAHRVVLCSASDAFAAMFFGPLKEKEVVTIVDSTSTAFRIMLDFIYTDKVTLAEETLADVLYLAKKYDIEGLRVQCLDYIKRKMNRKNVVPFYNDLTFFGETCLVERCLAEMDTYAHYLINNNEYLKHFTKDLFAVILKRDTFCAREVDIFDAIKWWIVRDINQKNKKEDEEEHVEPDVIRKEMEELIPLIRFPLMTMKEFVQIVVPTKILTTEETMEVLTAYRKDVKTAADRKCKFSGPVRCLNRKMNVKTADLMNPNDEITIARCFERAADSALRAVKLKVNQRLFLTEIDIDNVPARICNQSFNACIRILDTDLNEVVGRFDYVLKRDEQNTNPRGGKYELDIGMIELCPKIGYEILFTIEGPKGSTPPLQAKAHARHIPEMTLTIEKFPRVFPEEMRIGCLHFVY